MPFDQDTIVAIATPPGRGGIGVVRLSGPGAMGVAESMLRLDAPLAAGRARLTHVLDAAGEVLDEAVVTFFAAPRSYTAEDVVEIAAHGAPVLLDYLVRAACARGARLAEPGEFTERAFLAGRLDLTQAEAVEDLIAARTLYQAKTAAAQLGGAVAEAVRPVKQALLELIAALEAGVDFAEDDLDLLADAEIAARIAAVDAPLKALAGSYAHGRIVREGLTLAIVGAPNAGKSSLFNRLLGQERAIVTASPGTTRDTVAETLALDGIPLRLVDTAGLRELAAGPETAAERAGIVRSRHALAEADLVLHVVDSSALVGRPGGLNAEDEALQSELRGRQSILVFNKIDLAGPGAGGALPASVATSALTGAGMDELLQAIRDTLAAQPEAGSAVVTNLRQSQALEAARASLGKTVSALRDGFAHEFLLLDLHEALDHLDALTGATAPEAVLRLIFSRFCIGK